MVVARSDRTASKKLDPCAMEAMIAGVLTIVFIVRCRWVVEE
jgi:hypothetical protein